MTHPQSVLDKALERGDFTEEERLDLKAEMFEAVLAVILEELPDEDEIRVMCGCEGGPSEAATPPDPATVLEES